MSIAESTDPSVGEAERILDRTSTDEIRNLIQYWLRIHPGDRLPSRSMIDPIDLGELLPNIFLLDFDPETNDFLMKVCGTAVVEWMGTEPTGRRLGEVFPDFEQSGLAAVYRKAISTAKPIHLFGRPLLRYRTDWSERESVLLPLSSDGVTADKLLGGFVLIPA